MQQQRLQQWKDPFGSIGSERLTQGMSVYFTSAQDMVNELQQKQTAGRIDKRLQRYLKPTLLIVDEIGYLTLDKTGATVLFQLLSKLLLEVNIYINF